MSAAVAREFRVGLYLDPPERALVPCVDEKSQIQALNRTQPALPMWPGLPVCGELLICVENQ
jgi:hypothetical protein